MVIKLGINGFGRIGRVIFRAGVNKADLEIVAINDPAIDIEYICYLIKFDSTHGKFYGSVTHTKDEIFVNGNPIKVFHEKLPSSVPWQTAGVQYVIEASGMFTSLEKASGHLASDGVKRVIVTAPSVDVPMVILGVNQNRLNAGQKVISCASSTLYCLAPIIKILEDSYGVADGFITSIHAMTPSLKPLDGLCLRGKHWRDHRSIHQNIIPATTGACKALGRIIPRVKDKLAGLAFRVPIVNVSVLDLTIRLNSNTSIQEIIKSVEKASSTAMQNIIKISKEEAVSSDFVGESHSCILDADSSLQLNPNFFKLVCWYENEYSYACRVLDSIFYSEKQILLNLNLLPKSVPLKTCLSKKQDMVQQTDSCKKDILGSASHDTGLKSKQPQSRMLMLKKPFSSHNSGTTPSVNSNKDTKKRSEIFKIWNDDKEIPKSATRQNRNAFFHSCVTIAPQNREEIECIKAHERLEMLKKEFTKMVNITESLLKKSYIHNVHTKQEDQTTNKNERSNVSPQIKTEDVKRSCETFTEICDNVQQGSPIYDMGDFRSDTISSRASKISNKAEECHSIEKTTPQLQIKPKVNNYDYQNKTKMLQNGPIDNLTFNNAIKSPAPIHMSSLCNNSTGIPPDKIFNIVDNNEQKENKRHHTNLETKNLTQNLHIQCCMVECKNHKDGTYIKPALKIAQETQGKETLKWNSQIGSNDNKFSSLFKKKNIEESSQNKQGMKIFPGPVANDDITAVKKSKNCINNTGKEILIQDIPKDIVITTDAKDDNIHQKTENMVTLTDDTQGTLLDTGENTDFVHSKMSLDDINRSSSPERNITESDHTSKCGSPETTSMTVSNVEVNKHKQDIYDKLDSISGTDSNNSFQMNERKSQIINIADLTSSLEDLSRLDKICKIIEISDELSNKLFSALDHSEGISIKKKKWSFKDLCERIKFDEFCENIFGKPS